MAVFLTDSFTDTAAVTLASHVGEVGATWAKESVFSGQLVISNANRVRPTDLLTVAGYYASGLPASPNYAVEGVFRWFDDLNYLAVTGRANRIGSHYAFRYSSTYWSLTKTDDAGALTEIGAHFNQALVAGTNYTALLVMVGSSIKGFVDGVERCSATDTTITTSGRAGISTFSWSNDAQGFHVDSIRAYDEMLPLMWNPGYQVAGSRTGVMLPSGMTN